MEKNIEKLLNGYKSNNINIDENGKKWAINL